MAVITTLEPILANFHIALTVCQALHTLHLVHIPAHWIFRTTPEGGDIIVPISPAWKPKDKEVTSLFNDAGKLRIWVGFESRQSGPSVQVLTTIRKFTLFLQSVSRKMESSIWRWEHSEFVFSSELSQHGPQRLPPDCYCFFGSTPSSLPSVLWETTAFFSD